MYWSGYASGCYTTVSKRACVKLYRVSGSYVVVSGPNCSSYSTSSSRQTATISNTCANLGAGTYQSLGYVEVQNQPGESAAAFSPNTVSCP